MMILFLDFDGVLHRTAGPPFEYVDRLALCLAPYPKVRIVVTSSWRDVFTLEALRHKLGPLGDRVFDVTPHIVGASRQEEIETWLTAHADCTAWIALDDQAELFANRTPWLIQTNAGSGFDGLAVRMLERWLELGEWPAGQFSGESRLDHSHGFVPGQTFKYAIDLWTRRISVSTTHIDTALLSRFWTEIAEEQLKLGGIWSSAGSAGSNPTDRWAVRFDAAGQYFDVELLGTEGEPSEWRTVRLTPAIEPW